jgi:hypothetical protein
LNVSKVDQVLHLFSPPSVAGSLPAPAGHPYDVVAGSFQIRGATRPAPLVARASAAPCEEWNGVQRAGIRMRTSVRTGAC